MASAGIVVSVSMGVMKPLLSKLAILMGDKYKKLKVVRNQLSFLNDELTTMNAFLESLELLDDNLDPLAKDWRSHVREMAYDIEDCIDDFLHNLESTPAPSESEGFVTRFARYLRTLFDHHRIANQIDELKARVLEAGERRKRYNLDEHLRTSGPSSSVAVDPRVKAIYTEAANLVGIDGPREELVKMLTDQAEQQLKVVSIVGFGGLGKTTLAKEAYHNILSNVYDDIGEKFGCNAFVSVSQRPDISSLLSSIQSKLGIYNSSPAHDMQDIIDTIKDHLEHKRYLIVVDDLWDVPSWEIIKCVFPENDKQSRVIVTTRHQDVATSCSSGKGGIHYMKPLSDQDSRKLFNKRIFGSEDGCPPQFIDVSCEILKKCAGLPLSIITVASILACRPTRLKEEWEYIQDCLLASQAPPTNSTLADMMHILDLSYKFLPRHLKACFLYLGTYPEDYEIDKDELVRKWVAEGFVSGPTRRGAWDVAENYLNELVNRSMIQPGYRLDDIIMLPYYKVHDMMLDLILKRCTENNFIRLVHDQQAMAELQDKVRRLSIHTAADVTIGRQLSQVRSVSLFGANCVPPLSELRFLRVLFLNGFSRHTQRIDLTCVSQLSQLRYLKVARDAWYIEPECHVVLPNHIRSMHHLETLELECLNVSSIPPDIVDLPCLSHLSVGCFKMLPDGIGKVKTLRTLGMFRLPADSSGIVIESLGELTNLAELSLCSVYCRVEGPPTWECIPMTTAWMAAWSSSLLKLANLRKLRVGSHPYSCCPDALMSTWISPPFPFLEELGVIGWTFSRVPRWIGGLHNLHTLGFGVEVSNLTWDDIGTIGMLPNLIRLYVRVEGDVPDEGIVIGGSTGFKLLQVFRLQIKSTSHLAFKAGAMPNLRRLGLIVDPKECGRATAPVGLEHLASLERISLYGAKGLTQTLSQNTEASFDAFRAMFREAINGVPTKPAFDYSIYYPVYRPWDEEDNNDDDEATTTMRQRRRRRQGNDDDEATTTRQRRKIDGNYGVRGGVL